MSFERMNILGIEIAKADYNFLLRFIETAIQENQKITISYSTAHTLNTGYLNKSLQNKYNSLSLVHPDGIGIYIASKILYGKNCLRSRCTGSDFYPLLADKSVKEGWSIFFFGDKTENLERIYSVYPELKISGVEEGYHFNSNEVVRKINSASPDILVIGLGAPKQEAWLTEFYTQLNFKVAILVGDGIKVFAGVKKRGSKIIQKIGLEWFVRLMTEPKRMFVRYMIGNPLFIFRVFKQKLKQTL